NLARCELAIVLLVTFDIRCLDIIKCKVAAFLIAEFGHPSEEIGIERGLPGLNADKADTQHLRLQLRTRRKGPRRRRAADRCDELTASHSCPGFKTTHGIVSQWSGSWNGARGM